jgi:hypothetical protein
MDKPMYQLARKVKPFCPVSQAKMQYLPAILSNRSSSLGERKASDRLTLRSMQADATRFLTPLQVRNYGFLPRITQKNPCQYPLRKVR